MARRYDVRLHERRVMSCDENEGGPACGAGRLSGCHDPLICPIRRDDDPVSMTSAGPIRAARCSPANRRPMRFWREPQRRRCCIHATATRGRVPMPGERDRAGAGPSTVPTDVACDPAVADELDSASYPYMGPLIWHNCGILDFVQPDRPASCPHHRSARRP